MTIKEQLLALGVDIQPIYDGTPHQIQDPKGWYVGHKHTINGESAYTVILGLWKSDERHILKEGMDKLKGKALSEFSRLTRLQQTIEEAYRKDLNLKTKAIAQVTMEGTVESGGFQTEYMKRKKWMQWNADAPVLLDKECPETIFVPMRTLDGELWSVQKIYMSGDKEFLEGGRVQGTCFIFGDLMKSDRCYLVEGVATGMSVYCATGQPTVCAFNATNLATMAKEIKAHYPLINLTVAGDDDHENERNIGKEKALLAAQRVRARFLLPVFKAPHGLTDWNDLHVTEGLPAVAEQLKPSPDDVQDYLLPLGYNKAHHYYTSSSNPQILSLTEHSESELYQLMPRDYWLEIYGARMTKEGEVSLRLSEIKSDLMERCRKRGHFKAERIRGLGVWQDGGKTIVHLGNRLHFEGNERTLMSLGEKNLYEFSEVQAGMAIPASLSDLASIHNVLENLAFTNPKHRFYLGGWIVGAYICGSLDWRPHLNITGEQGAGKSTVLSQFITPLLSGYKNFPMRGATTEAGVRQSIKSHAVPVIFDEFEGENSRSQFRLETVIELFRQASSEQGGGILKGTASGEAQEYQARFMGIVSGIHPQITAGADKARFTQIEIRKVTENADAQWLAMQEHLQLIDTKLAAKLFSRSVNMLDTIKANIKKCQNYLAKLQNQRFGQQYGTLLGCYHSLVSDEVITDAELATLAAGIVEDEAHGGDKDGSDHEDCLDVLLQTLVRYQDDEGANRENSLGSLMVREPGLDWEKHPNREVLANRGIFLTKKDGIPGFLIASTHVELKKIFRDTNWRVNWTQAIGRIKGTVKGHRVKFHGKLVRGVFVPVEFEAPTVRAPF